MRIRGPINYSYFLRNSFLPTLFLGSFCLILILLLAGCSRTKISPEESYKVGFRLSRALIEEYGEINNRSEISYLNYLADRLLSNWKQRKNPHLEYQFTILNTPKPLAYSPGGGFILLSKGLILSLSQEAELAFVVAHEMAHQELNHIEIHHSELGPTTDGQESWADRSAQAETKLELAADQLALGMIGLAGYDPRAASAALLNSYGAARLGVLSPSDLNTRLVALQNSISKANWHGPGTLDRREFHKFCAALIE